MVGVLSNTVHVGHHRRPLLRYSIITALTWPKLAHICSELEDLGQRYKVCPPLSFYTRRSPAPDPVRLDLRVVPFFGKRAAPGGRSRRRGRGRRTEAKGEVVWTRDPVGSDVGGEEGGWFGL